MEHNKRNIRNISLQPHCPPMTGTFLESSYYSVWTPWFKQTDKNSIQYYVELHRTSCYAKWDHHVQAISCEMQVAEDDILTRLLTSNPFWARIHTITREFTWSVKSCIVNYKNVEGRLQIGWDPETLMVGSDQITWEKGKVLH